MQICAGDKQVVGLIQTPHYVIAPQPHGKRNVFARRYMIEAFCAVLMVLAYATVRAQTRLLETKPPMVMQGNQASRACSFCLGNEIGAHADYIMKMNNVDLSRMDNCSKASCGGRPVKIEIGIQGAQGETVDGEPLVEIETQSPGRSFV